MSTLYLGHLIAGAGENDTIKVDSKIQHNEQVEFINGALFNTPVQFNNDVAFQYAQSPIRRLGDYTRGYTTRGNEGYFPEMEATFSAKAGEFVTYKGLISGRTNDTGHTYFNLELDGALVLYTSADWNSTWVRQCSLLHSFIAPSTKEYTYKLKLKVGSGASNFGNSPADCGWVVEIGGGI